jgi:hypothetical protein
MCHLRKIQFVESLLYVLYGLNNDATIRFNGKVNGNEPLFVGRSSGGALDLEHIWRGIGTREILKVTQNVAGVRQAGWTPRKL